MMTTREAREDKTIEAATNAVKERRLMGEEGGISPMDELMARDALKVLKENGWGPIDGTEVERLQQLLIKAMYHLHKHVIHAGTDFEEEALNVFGLSAIMGNIHD